MGYCSYEHRILLKGDKQLPTSWHEALYDFSVHGCGLTGQIPSELGLLSAIEYASFTSNSFSGRIPFLLWLTLGENSLEGEIPSELGPLSLLFEFDLRQNSLTGPIPSELGMIGSAGSGMWDFWLFANSLTGTIPSQLGEIPYLEFLELQDNDLSGSIPVELVNLTVGLLKFNVSGNEMITGLVPPELCYINETHPLTFFECTDKLCGCSCNCTDENAL